MKPISICHANKYDTKKHILINVFLTDEDKELIYKYHMEKYPDNKYNKEDISMIAFIELQYGEINILNFLNVCYYPEEQGEMEIPNEYLTEEFIKECTKFILFHYFGNEAKYDIA